MYSFKDMGAASTEALAVYTEMATDDPSLELARAMMQRLTNMHEVHRLEEENAVMILFSQAEKITLVGLMKDGNNIEVMGRFLPIELAEKVLVTLAHAVVEGRQRRGENP